MKLTNLYNYYADYLGGGTIIPDEIDYLLSIVEIVADYFSHSNYNFYLTNKVDFVPKTNNNIIFLSGSEGNGKLHTDNFLLCFNNFYIEGRDERYCPFPLGINKFLNKTIKTNLEIIPFQNRKYKCFFAGYIHPSRISFYHNLQKLTGNNYFHFATGNNLQTFDNNLNPEEYLKIALDSKVMLCPAGGQHTSSYRYFESLYCKNIAIYPKSDMHKIFFEAENPIAYAINSWEELNDDLINSLIESYPSKEKQAEEHFKKITSKTGVINYIIQKIEKIKIGN